MKKVSNNELMNEPTTGWERQAWLSTLNPINCGECGRELDPQTEKVFKNPRGKNSEKRKWICKKCFERFGK